MLAYLFLAASIASYVFLVVYVKKISARLDVLSLIIGANIVSDGSFILKEIAQHMGEGTKVLDQFTLNITVADWPFHILLILTLAFTKIIWAYIIENYSLSLATIYFQSITIFSSIFYLMLGAPLHWISIISLAIIFAGSMVASIQHGTHAKTDKKLIISALAYSLLYSISAALVFLLSQKTGATKDILDMLSHFKNMDLHAYFLNPTNLRLSAQLISMVLVVLYMAKKSILYKFKDTIKGGWKEILIASALFITYIVCFYQAYTSMANKVEFLALLKLQLPGILVASVFFLKEKLNRNQIIGSLIIIAGNCLPLLKSFI